MWNGAVTPGTVDSGDGQAIELGVKFIASTNGTITGIRFYKSAANTGVHTASLWNAAGQLLATATFTGETTSGWQQVNFATPVAITAGATYVASYHTNTGHYSVNRSYFNSSIHQRRSARAGQRRRLSLWRAAAFPTIDLSGQQLLGRPDVCPQLVIRLDRDWSPTCRRQEKAQSAPVPRLTRFGRITSVLER